MALTYSQYVGDGSTRLFAVTFPYISKSHVKVRVDGNEVPFTWSTPTLVQLDMVPSAGAVIDIRRETPNTEPLVDFHDGSTLVESDLDLATIQSLYIAQEVVDRLNGKIGADTDGTINADGRRIKNAALPVASNDVATKGYVDGTTGNAPAYAAQAQEAATSATESAGVAAASADVASSAAAQAATSAAEAFENSKKTVTPFIWTAAEGQTEFPFGQAIEPALVLVFVSGAKYPLGMGDYAITPTKITLSSPAAAGDIVEAYVFAPFTVANAVLPGNNLAELSDKAAARTNLGLGSAAVENAGTGANQLLKLGADGKVPAGNLYGAALSSLRTPTGLAELFSGIPAGVNKVSLYFHNVSLNGTANFRVRLGTASGLVATGYNTYWANTGATYVAGAGVTDGVGVVANAAARKVSGRLLFERMGGNIWTYSGVFGEAAAVVGGYVGGSVDLGGALTQLQVDASNGTDTFDNGNLSIRWEYLQ